jgi:hypothetical protein
MLFRLKRALHVGSAATFKLSGAKMLSVRRRAPIEFAEPALSPCSDTSPRADSYEIKFS